MNSDLASEPKRRTRDPLALVVFALVVVVAAAVVLLAFAGGFRVWGSNGAIAAEGGCGSVVSTGEVLFETNEATCSNYRVVRILVAALLILVLAVVFIKGRHRLRAAFFGALLVALSAMTPFLPIRPIESDFSGWTVHHGTVDCSEFMSHVDLVGTTTWTDATEDDQCHEHLSPLRATGRVLLGGGMVILTFAGVRRATQRWR